MKTPLISNFMKLLVRLRIYRNGCGLTQEDIAKKLNISLRTYQRIEQGTAPLEMALLYKIGTILNVDYERLTLPSLTESDLKNVQFIPDLNHLPGSIKCDKDSIAQVFDELKADIEHKRLRIKDLHKNKNFKNHDLPFFYSDPSHTWINKTLAKSMASPKSTKISVMKNLSDFEFIVRLWEVCYEKENPWYLSSTEHHQNGEDIRVTTLANFTLHSGLPLVFGSVVASEKV